MDACFSSIRESQQDWIIRAETRSFFIWIQFICPIWIEKGRGNRETRCIGCGVSRHWMPLYTSIIRIPWSTPFQCSLGLRIRWCELWWPFNALRAGLAGVNSGGRDRGGGGGAPIDCPSPSEEKESWASWIYSFDCGERLEGEGCRGFHRQAIQENNRSPGSRKHPKTLSYCLQLCMPWNK